MQIITGKIKGRKMVSPDSARPTLQRVKISLFSMIDEFITADAEILDLFAGSGSLGIECISRGAKFTTLCDVNKQATKCIEQNLRNIDKDLYKILNLSHNDALLLFAKMKHQFNIVFLDPPYDSKFLPVAVDKIIRYNLLKPNGIMVIETDEKNILQDFPKCCIINKQRSYGTANIMILQKVE